MKFIRSAQRFPIARLVRSGPGFVSLRTGKMSQGNGCDPSKDIANAIVECASQLRSYALYLARNSADADDLVHDCVERALRKSHQFQIGTDLKMWLVTIMRSIFVSGIRKKKTSASYINSLRSESSSWNAPEQEYRMELQDCAERFDRLNKQQRDVLRLFALEQHSHSEIAAIMGSPVATTKTRLFRARENLARMMEGTL